MRALSGTILATAMMLGLQPAAAQNYDPNYPVCLQTYGWDGDYIACAYTSIAQCQATASGRSAQCYPNPYFRPSRPTQWRRERPY